MSSATSWRASRPAGSRADRYPRPTPDGPRPAADDRLDPPGRCPILRRLKRWLKPLRPVLIPVYRLVAPIFDPSWRNRPKKTPPIPDPWTGPTPDTVHRGTAIRVITEPEFEAVAATAPKYYRGRRRYISAAATAADDLIARHGLRSALELGPHLRPLIVGADVMDRNEPTDLIDAGKVVVHDAREAPWPFADGAYDLFVALQVFEHIVGGQEAAFREVRRVARHAVISLPSDWVMTDPTNCHHMISNERALSWFAPVEPTRILVGNEAPGKRLIYVFEDLAPA